MNHFIAVNIIEIYLFSKFVLIVFHVIGSCRHDVIDRSIFSFGRMIKIVFHGKILNVFMTSHFLSKPTVFMLYKDEVQLGGYQKSHFFIHPSFT